MHTAINSYLPCCNTGNQPQKKDCGSTVLTGRSSKCIDVYIYSYIIYTSMRKCIETCQNNLKRFHLFFLNLSFLRDLVKCTFLCTSISFFIDLCIMCCVLNFVLLEL